MAKKELDRFATNYKKDIKIQTKLRLLRPWDSPGKNTGVGCYFLLQCMKVERESEVGPITLHPKDPLAAQLAVELHCHQ